MQWAIASWLHTGLHVVEFVLVRGQVVYGQPAVCSGLFVIQRLKSRSLVQNRRGLRHVAVLWDDEESSLVPG